jgi:transcriptional regulator with XRE-family HTH domain
VPEGKRNGAAFSQLGSYLFAVRNLRRLTQSALAKRCGVKQSDISKIEWGEKQPSLELLTKLAQVLEVSLQWFATGSNYSGLDLRDIAIELQHLGMVDLLVLDPVVPGAFRPPEQILAWVLSGNLPEVRLVEAVPAVLAWNHWNVRLLEAYGYTYDRRAVTRLAWLADVALTIHRTWTFPGGCPAKQQLDEFLTRIPQPEEHDSLGRPDGEGKFSPVSKRWKITYAANLDDFRRRAEHLHSLLIDNLTRRASGKHHG